MPEKREDCKLPIWRPSFDMCSRLDMCNHVRDLTDKVDMFKSPGVDC